MSNSKYPDIPSNLSYYLSKYLKDNKLTQKSVINSINSKLDNDKHKLYLQDNGVSTTFKKWLKGNGRPKEPEVRRILLSILKISQTESIFKNGMSVANYLLNILVRFENDLRPLESKANEEFPFTSESLNAFLAQNKLERYQKLVELLTKISEQHSYLDATIYGDADAASPKIHLVRNESLINGIIIKNDEERKELEAKNEMPPKYNVTLSRKQIYQHTITNSELLEVFINFSARTRHYMVSNFNRVNKPPKDMRHYPWLYTSVYQEMENKLSSSLITKNEQLTVFNAGISVLNSLLENQINLIDHSIRTTFTPKSNFGELKFNVE